MEYLSSWFSFLTLNIFPTDNKFQNLTSILYSWKIKIAVEEPATISTTVVDEDSAEVSSSKQEQLPKKLTLMPVIFLIYFEVAGGPYGLEQAVPATGALLAILGFLVFPFIWSVAEALITAELCTALPGNGGFIIWGERAFGPPFRAPSLVHGSSSALSSMSLPSLSSVSTTWKGFFRLSAPVRLGISSSWHLFWF